MYDHIIVNLVFVQKPNGMFDNLQEMMYPSGYYLDTLSNFENSAQPIHVLHNVTAMLVFDIAISHNFSDLISPTFRITRAWVQHFWYIQRRSFHSGLLLHHFHTCAPEGKHSDASCCYRTLQQ